MKTQSFTCPNCNTQLEPIGWKPIMFFPCCGSKIANDDIAFYMEDSKTARTETVTDAMTKILGQKSHAWLKKSEILNFRRSPKCQKIILHPDLKMPGTLS